MDILNQQMKVHLKFKFMKADLKLSFTFMYLMTCKPQYNERSESSLMMTAAVLNMMSPPKHISRATYNYFFLS